jgi:hypothetical protein
MSNKSQSVNINHVKARDIKINQTMGDGDLFTAPASKDEFISSVKKLVAELRSASDELPDIDDAIAELKSLLEEAKKPKPEPSAIKRFLLSAKGLLADIAGTVNTVSVVTAGITTLIGTIKPIFGG